MGREDGGEEGVIFLIFIGNLRFYQNNMSLDELFQIEKADLRMSPDVHVRILFILEPTIHRT